MKHRVITPSDVGGRVSLIRRAGSRSRSCVAAAVILAAAGCGSGAIEGVGSGGDAASPAPGSASPSATVSGGGGGGGGGEDEDEEEYSWTLPGGDLSVDSIGFAFNELRAGRCPESLSDDEFYSGGQVLLYRAATAVCSGDLEAARGHLEGAALTDHSGDCRLYKAILSVLDQRPQDSIPCPAPEPTSDETTSEPTSPAPEPSSDGDGTTSEPTSPAPGSTSGGEGANSEPSALGFRAVLPDATSGPAPRYPSY